MEQKNWLEQMSGKLLPEKLMETNLYTQRFGLVLTPEDTQLLAEERQHSLKERRRVEFGPGILPRLIRVFCDSPYIEQDTYVQTMARLQDIFFHYKNEMQDEVTDDELLQFMKEQFDGVCYGDLDYLEGTCLEIFAEAVRSGYRDHHKSGGSGEYAKFDEVTRWDRELYLEALKDQF